MKPGETGGKFDYAKIAASGKFFRRSWPLLDDWVDGKPDAWDYEAVLRENGVIVEWCDTFIDGHGNKTPAGELAGWSLRWKQGVIGIGRVTETIARKAAALFVSLYLRGVSASFADKLMDGYIGFLERQENISLTFLVEIVPIWYGRTFHLTRKGLCAQESLVSRLEGKIIEALDIQPDEEVFVTFTKRKR